MATPPLRTGLADTYPNPSNATFRTAIGAFYDYVAGLLGSTGNALEALDALSIGPVQNSDLWINSDFGINQRAAASTADGNYGFDRTVNLCDGGSVTLSQLAQPTDGIPYALRQLQPDASPKRMGSVQIVEARNCLAYRGKKLVFAPKFRCSASVTIRVALVAWTSTADSPPRDVVNSWTSTTYTAGNFFISNTTTIAVGSAALTAATWTDVAVSSASAGGIPAPASMNNLYLVYWTDTAVAQNVTLDASVMRAGQGTVLPAWTPPDASAELLKCMRYCQKSYSFGVAPGSSELGGNNGRAIGIDTNTAIIFAPMMVEMRAVPVITTYQPFTGTVATIRSVGGASISIAGPTSIGTKGVGLTYTSAGLFTVGTIYDFNWLAIAEVGV
jgi:hypothetical protein